MKELGCYSDEQKKEIETADIWAFPACASLNNAQKIDRERLTKEELWRVTSSSKLEALLGTRGVKGDMA
eukprot:1153531-Pelagomonas_calceolata.AAC.1